MRRVVATGLLALGLVGAVVWDASAPLPSPATPLEARLDFTGPVRRMVSVQTQEGGHADLGVSTHRTVTEVARDGRSATETMTSTYRKRNGEVSVRTWHQRFALAGSSDTFTLSVTDDQEPTQSVETASYQGRCAVRSVTRHVNPRGQYTSVTVQTCDSRGRVLTASTRHDDRLMHSSTTYWIGNRIGVGRAWNAGLEQFPAQTHWALIVIDRSGNSQMFSPLVYIRTEQHFDARGNWVFRHTRLIPAALSGTTIETRETSYWDGKTGPAESR